MKYWLEKKTGFLCCYSKSFTLCSHNNFSLLQEAFFGKILLDKCRDTKEKLDSDNSDRDSPVFAQKAPVTDVKEPCEETPVGSSSVAGNAPTSSEQSGEEMQPIVGKQ